MQREFEFNRQPPANTGVDPVALWRERRRAEHTQIAKALHLPLGHAVEVWLKDGVRLRGLLALAEEAILHAGLTQENARFAVGAATFTYAEIESCHRTD